MGNFSKTAPTGLVITFIALLFLVSISSSLHSRSEPVSITVMPEVPRKDIPIQFKFDLNNPSPDKRLVNYESYGNGELFLKGCVLLPGYSTKRITYVYPPPPGIGERVTFHVRAISGQDEFEKTISVPAYPPQVWSSFVSFATFSSSIMASSMSTQAGTMEFYNTNVNNNGLNVGMVLSMTLIIMLVFIELTEPFRKKISTVLGALRSRFNDLSVILFVVFAGMVVTRVVMIIG